MSLKPLGDRIVARQIDAKEATKSGIVLPSSAQEKPQEAKVLSVGTGRLLDNGSVKRLEVKTGQHILYHVARPNMYLSDFLKYLFWNHS